MHRIPTFRALGWLAVTLSVGLLPSRAQQADSPNPQLAMPKTQPQSEPSTTTGPVVLTLERALDLARKNSPQLQAAITDEGVAHEDRDIARAGLLPNVNFNTAAIYTETNALGAPKYIANNAEHEYISQGNVHQQLDVAAFSSYKSSAALAAAAKARREIAARGLVAVVIQNYFAVSAAEQKLAAAQVTAKQGEDFLQLTQSLEKGGEVAHADVIKADLQRRDRRRQLQEAQLAVLNARLYLAFCSSRILATTFRSSTTYTNP